MDILCENCGKKVDEDNCIYTMDSSGEMFAFCNQECCNASIDSTEWRRLNSMDRGAGINFGGTPRRF